MISRTERCRSTFTRAMRASSPRVCSIERAQKRAQRAAVASARARAANESAPAAPQQARKRGTLLLPAQSVRSESAAPSRACCASAITPALRQRASALRCRAVAVADKMPRLFLRATYDMRARVARRQALCAPPRAARALPYHGARRRRCRRRATRQKYTHAHGSRYFS